MPSASGPAVEPAEDDSLERKTEAGNGDEGGVDKGEDEIGVDTLHYVTITRESAICDDM